MTWVAPIPVLCLTGKGHSKKGYGLKFKIVGHSQSSGKIFAMHVYFYAAGVALTHELKLGYSKVYLYFRTVTYITTMARERRGSQKDSRSIKEFIAFTELCTV